MDVSNELINKYNISEQDLYTLGIIETKKDSVGFFEKEKLKAKSMGVLKPYNVKFMDLGNLLNVIKTQGYHKDQTLIDKYGNIDLESKKSSLGMKYVIPVIVGIVVFFYIFSGGGKTTEQCKDEVRAYEFGREMATWTSLRGGGSLSNAIVEYSNGLGVMSPYNANNDCVKRGYNDSKSNKKSPYNKNGKSWSRF